MNVADARYGRHDPSRLGVDHDDRAVSKMRDEEELPLDVQRLVIEARRISRQRDFGDSHDRQCARSARRLKRRERQHSRYSQPAGANAAIVHGATFTCEIASFRPAAIDAGDATAQKCAGRGWKRYAVHLDAVRTTRFMIPPCGSWHPLLK